TFSLALTLECASLDGLSLVIGVAVAEALDRGGSKVKRKWPNDLLLVDDDEHARKLGGVLIESVAVGSQRMVVIGVGLNVKPQAVVGELASGFACVQEFDENIGAPALLAQVAPPLVSALRLFERDGFSAFVQRFQARDL